MRFSIVTPVRDGLPHLPRCVGSVRGQRGVALEHIMWDGGSTDGSLAWARAQPDLCVHSEPDQGMYDAVNKGWAAARGDILSWLNSDEQYLPGALATVEAHFRRHPEVEAVFGDALVVDRNGDPVAARREIPLRAAYVRNGFLYALSCTLFFRRTLQERGWLTFDPSFRLAGDADLVLGLLERGVRFAHVSRYLALFGVSGSNLSMGNSAGWAQEVARFRRRHGAHGASWIRRAILLGRYVERLFAGCYRAVDVAYDFSLDEGPTYRRVAAERLRGRFTYDRFVQERKERRQ
jgi:glycosyltransferase involved in cell wall biosynthesis